jgi:hypothetical protein
MIYAPPSREKSKQTMRSPLLDSKNAGNHPSVGPIPQQQYMGINSDEYMMAGGNYNGSGAPVGTANGGKRVKPTAGTVYGVQ